MELQEAQYDEMVDVAVAAGFYRRCTRHPEIVLQDYGDERYVFAQALARYNASEMRTPFTSRDTLLKTAKAIVDEPALSHCPRCGRSVAE